MRYIDNTYITYTGPIYLTFLFVKKCKKLLCTYHLYRSKLAEQVKHIKNYIKMAVMKHFCKTGKLKLKILVCQVHLIDKLAD